MNVINILSEHISNQIAAGEVIQRPASVVKELLENAIDSGAEEIKVFIKDGGRTSILVQDSGKGMTADDALLSFKRHATSKLKRVNDLFKMQTKGFRIRNSISTEKRPVDVFVDNEINLSDASLNEAPLYKLESVTLP